MSKIASLVLGGLLSSPVMSCGSAGNVGLANGPSINRPWDDQDLRTEVVSNGPGSCPSRRGEKIDPLWNRQPPCTEASKVTSVSYQPDAGTAQRSDPR
jgi:hypothetical protein